MRVIKYEHECNITTEEPFICYFFADTHFGNPGVQWKLLDRHIAQCKRERARWFHLGDWCEFISPNDRRFSIAEPAPTVVEQIAAAIDVFKPIKDQCLGVLAGNHESTISKYYGDVMHQITDALNIPYLGYSGFVSLQFKKSQTQKKGYILFLHHGHGMGALLGAKAINLHRLSHKFEADIYGIGHIHTWSNPIDDLIAVKSSGLRHPMMTKKRRYYFSCPSYFDPYVPNNGSNYAEQKALYPQPCGCVRMEIGIYNNEWYVKIEAMLD
jgi:hypothetical protein